MNADRFFNRLHAVDPRADDAIVVALRMTDSSSRHFPRALKGALSTVDRQSRRDYVAFWQAHFPDLTPVPDWRTICARK